MRKEDIRIIFMGTPEFAVATLEKLCDNHCNVVAVVTQPDKPVGRHGSVLQASEVKKYALAKGIPVLQPVKMKDPEFLEQLRAFNADLQVVVAFRMLPEVVWAMPRWGTFNVHAALLPQYRGAAPINWAVINGEKVTGVTTFFLDHEIDTGRIILRRPFDIPDEADVEYVYDGLMHLGAQAALDTVSLIAQHDGQVESVPQQQLTDEGMVLHPAPKIFNETCRIDWSKTTKQIYDFVRGLSPFPGTWTMVKMLDGTSAVLKVFKTTKFTDRSPIGQPGTIIVEKNQLFVSTGDGMLRIDLLQMAGKKRMEAKAFLNGVRDLASME